MIAHQVDNENGFHYALHMTRPGISGWASLMAAGSLLLTACSTADSAMTGSASQRVIRVVAAEDFWGSIAAQVGSRHVQVISIITSPNADPHSYEPNAADGRQIAAAQLVIENGIGYDPWVSGLIGATSSQPALINVGAVLGVPDGGNPHRWYNPGNVETVITAMVAAFSHADPADRAYFRQQQHHFETIAMRPYRQLIDAIRARYSGTPVGASESIFAMLAPALGLRLITPYSFLRAISEGTEVTVADKLAIDKQIRDHRIKIYVYNSQNVTPDVRAPLAAVKAEHIPTATITETLVPASSTYQAWQAHELRGIEKALAQAAKTPG
jgi:zinc/manganese transport system substrate-binding protein